MNDSSSFDPAPPDPFGPIAPFYDLDLEGYDDDIELYERLAEVGWKRVLELGCGTGRVSLALASAGLEVTGVDLSAAMLQIAQARAAEVGVKLVQADMRRLALSDRFDAVIVPLGGLQHLTELDDVVAAFRAIADHLAEDGLAVIDVEAPHPDDLSPGPQPLIEHWTREWWTGAGEGAEWRMVTKLVSIEARPADGVRDVTWHFDVQQPQASLQRVTHRFPLRVFTPAELELAGRLAGLMTTGVFGDYALNPFSGGDERLIMTFQHEPPDAEERRA